MAKPFRQVRMLCFVLGAALGLSLVGALAKHELLFSRQWYLANIILMMALSLALFAWAFLWSKCNAPGRLSDRLLLVSVGLFLWSALDGYVTFFRFDTYGRGSRLSLTSRSWYDTYVKKNPQGFWGRDLAPYRDRLPGPKKVILAVGDSYTWGQGLLDARDRFTDRLEVLLRESHLAEADVVNVGVGGADTVDETKTIREFGPMVRPDIVMVFYLSNDIKALDVLRDPPQTMSSLLRLSLVVSPAFNFLYWTFIGPRLYQSEGASYQANLLFAYLDESAMEHHLGEIREMVESIRALKAKPVFVILPCPRLWNNVNEAYQTRIYKRISDAVLGMGVEVLPLQSIEKQMTVKEFSVGPMDAHPSRLAHEKIADALFRWFKEKSFLLTEN